ncbi:nuclear transport factor 2 family protein [Pontimicrobium aquaticum]|uniref:Nuclear transport factor 2 family protein n=1 Tax=Pontimicrobium aquaticum TaxID=2565367 RepID=A0A4U0EQL8_9FLAO|nr:nuclear transport factor 2 family protein [Pontimicrobium aquaticum]TJY33910.1 nuclear transport factor 2 family protein [Pontimicrobium aquaticum]
MLRILLLCLCLTTTAMYSQDDKTAKVKAAIDTFFEGFHKGDTTMMKTVMYGKFTTQTAFKNQKGEDVLRSSESTDLVNAIANRPDTEKWDERLLDYIIKVDNNMANAWTPYEFWRNGEFSHCGVNSFQLFNDNGQWKIIYLIDTRQRTGCNEGKN